MAIGEYDFEKSRSTTKSNDHAIAVFIPPITKYRNGLFDQNAIIFLVT